MKTRLSFEPNRVGWGRHVALGRTAAIVAVIVILLGVAVVYAGLLANAGHQTSTSSSSTTAGSPIQGIVAGYVTVGPSSPSCSSNESLCTESLQGYSLQFASECGTTSSASSSSCQGETFNAPIAPSGHYSILLKPGNFTITGLSPFCRWAGCSSAFPKTVTVQPGGQIIVNINIDTGIK